MARLCKQNIGWACGNSCAGLGLILRQVNWIQIWLWERKDIKFGETNQTLVAECLKPFPSGLDEEIRGARE
jgi:hypothetical protein